MVLVDTSVWIDFYNTNAETPDLDRVIELGEAATTGLVMVEVLQGFRLTDRRRHRVALNDLNACHYLALSGKPLAMVSAQNYRQLRSKGVTPRGPIDVVLATLCIESDIPFLTRDLRDFLPAAEHLGLRLLRY